VLLGAPINAAVKGFEPTTLSFKAGTPTHLQFNDEDPTAPHNVVIFEGKDATGTQVFEGALTNGPKQVTYQVPALAAGSYFFHCAVHPTTMHGNITVSATGGGGGGDNAGGGGAPTLAASNLTYSTDQLSWAADTPTTLTFDNQDAGTPHNFSIYSDDAYTDNVFKGDLVTGPATQEYQIPALAAGTYFYRCDVHPTMNGTLTVGAGSASGGGGGSPASATPASSGSAATPTASPGG
jgi:plastocyanin